MIDGINQLPAPAFFYQKDIIDGHALVGINEGIFKHTCSSHQPQF